MVSEPRFFNRWCFFQLIEYRDYCVSFLWRWVWYTESTGLLWIWRPRSGLVQTTGLVRPPSPTTVRCSSATGEPPVTTNNLRRPPISSGDHHRASYDLLQDLGDLGFALNRLVISVLLFLVLIWTLLDCTTLVFGRFWSYGCLGWLKLTGLTLFPLELNWVSLDLTGYPLFGFRIDWVSTITWNSEISGCYLPVTPFLSEVFSNSLLFGNFWASLGQIGTVKEKFLLFFGFVCYYWVAVTFSYWGF